MVEKFLDNKKLQTELERAVPFSLKFKILLCLLRRFDSFIIANKVGYSKESIKKFISDSDFFLLPKTKIKATEPKQKQKAKPIIDLQNGYNIDNTLLAMKTYRDKPKEFKILGMMLRGMTPFGLTLFNEINLDQLKEFFLKNKLMVEPKT